MSHTATDTSSAASPEYIARMNNRRAPHYAKSAKTHKLESNNGYTYFFSPTDNGTTMRITRYLTKEWKSYELNSHGQWPTPCRFSGIMTTEAREVWTDLKTGRDRNPNGVSIG